MLLPPVQSDLLPIGTLRAQLLVLLFFSSLSTLIPLVSSSSLMSLNSNYMPMTSKLTSPSRPLS